jgi:hypothetical protein
VLKGHGKDKRPFVIAHPAVPWTQIPARDGIGHGGIERSSVHPNCSYFRNWTSTDEKITWDVEVGAGGKYEVEIWYACPQGDVGSTIELRLGESRLRGKITEAHDPPLSGLEGERVPRTESYSKDFRPLKLGVIRLEKGPGTLTLQALDIPAKQVMEFRLLTLKRVD